MKNILLGLPLAACIAQVMASASASASPLQITDLLTLVRFAGGGFMPGIVAISPDGTRVAYVTATRDTGKDATVHALGADRMDLRQLWIQSFTGGSPLRVEIPEPDSYQPALDPHLAWSPDGKELAFYTGFDRRGHVAIWSRATQRLRLLNELFEVSVFTSPIQWTSDSTQIVVARKRAKASDTTAAEATTAPAALPQPAVTVFSSEATQSDVFEGEVVSRMPPDEQNAVDLIRVDVRTNVVAPLAKHLAPAFYELSPDGTQLLYAVRTAKVSGGGVLFNVCDVYLIDISSGTSAQIVRDVGMTSDVIGPYLMSWSHDGLKIAFLGVTRKSRELDVIDLHHPGTLRRLPGQDLDGIALRWSRDDTTIYAHLKDHSGIQQISLADGASKVALNLRDTVLLNGAQTQNGRYLYDVARTGDGKTQVYRTDTASGQSKVVFEGLKEIRVLSFSRDGKRAAYLQQDVAHPLDLWVADVQAGGFGNARQLTHLNPQIEEGSLSSMEETVSWRLPGGAMVDGVVLLPVGYRVGTRYPVLVYQYPGSSIGTMDRNLFGFDGTAGTGSVGAYLNMQLFASRGYAVFVPDCPDSALRVGHAMQDIANVILPGVDRLIAMGIADPERLGVWGQSYGGYGTLSLLVQTNRFKAAVVHAGFSSLITSATFLLPDGGDWLSDWAERSDGGRMGGTPWQYRDRYIENSPFFYLDRIQAPVLLEYGGYDHAGLVASTGETFVGLRRLGRTATIVGYADEGHGLVKASNQIDFFNRVIGWFDKYLRAGE